MGAAVALAAPVNDASKAACAEDMGFEAQA